VGWMCHGGPAGASHGRSLTDGKLPRARVLE